ncbi:MAG: aspartate aminotransferase family protein [Bacteroidales bacterium]
MEIEANSIRKLFFQHVAQTSPAPLGLEVQRADGVFLYTKNKKYLDFVSGVSVSNLGHGNKEIIAAVKKQVDDYFHLMVYGEMIEAPQVLHAKLLTSLLPENLNSVYYVNSGSEANEVALKLAKRITGRTEMISCVNAYHGSSHGSLSMIGSEYFKNAYRPLLPDVRNIRFNNVDDLKYITEKTACVLIEPIQAEGGVICPKDNYLKKLRKRCDGTSTMLIFDEVQTGFGRTGSLFACLKYDVVPDIITLAKALGGGMPLGACVSSVENLEAFQKNPILGHITTFGGHPVCCAAALASLKILVREKYYEDVERKSKIIEDALISNIQVKEIRRAGLLVAIDLGDKEKISSIIPKLLKQGLISDYFLFNPTSFRIAPPLIIKDEELEYGLNIIKKVLNSL